ncbi:MAG: hypothetical protein AVDCRST_MAG79-212, partial [uncultured Thermoleophilia bacterium]
GGFRREPHPGGATRHGSRRGGGLHRPVERPRLGLARPLPDRRDDRARRPDRPRPRRADGGLRPRSGVPGRGVVLGRHRPGRELEGRGGWRVHPGDVHPDARRRRPRAPRGVRQAPEGGRPGSRGVRRRLEHLHAPRLPGAGHGARVRVPLSRRAVRHGRRAHGRSADPPAEPLRDEGRERPPVRRPRVRDEGRGVRRQPARRHHGHLEGPGSARPGSALVPVPRTSPL